MDELFKLIKSLSRNEKRHFKLYSSAFSKKDADYLKLFDAIDKCTVYKEEEIKKELKIKHFSVTKRYLFDAILKSLRIYITEELSSFQTLDAFKNIYILRNRGCIKEAIKVYKKTEAQLEQQNLYTFLIELQNTGEILWSQYLPNKELSKKLEQIEHKKTNTLKELDNLVAYQLLSRKIRNTYRVVYPIRTQEQAQIIQAFLEHPLLLDEANALTSLAKSYFYESLTLCHIVLLQFEQMMFYAQKIVEQFLNIKKRSFPQQKGLMMNLSNLLLALSKVGQQDLYVKYDHIYKSQQKKLKEKLGKRFDVQAQKLYYNYHLNHLIENDDFKPIEALEKEVKIFWETYNDYLDLDWKMTVSFIIAQTLFFQGSYDQAINWLQNVLQEEKNNPKLPYICNARMLNVMIHFEQKEYLFLGSLILSTYRFLNRNDRLFKIEELMLKFFRWVAKHPTGNIQERKTQLYLQIEQEIVSNAYEKNFFSEMKLALWQH